jgi:hypothetical protein
MRDLREEKGKTIYETPLRNVLTVSQSREHSQTALNYLPGGTLNGVSQMNPTHDIEAAENALSKFSYDCTYFQRAKQELLANGWNETQIFGTAEIDVDTILLGFVDPQDSQTVSTWCSRTVNRILPHAPLVVRLASTWVLTKMMRVCVSLPASMIMANAQSSISSGPALRT